MAWALRCRVDSVFFYFFFQAEAGIRDLTVTEFRRVLFRSPVCVVHGPELLLAGEPRPPLQPAVRAAAAGVLSGPRRVARRRSALRPRRSRRHSAEPVQDRKSVV